MSKFKDKNPYVKAAIIIGALATVGVTGIVVARLIQRARDRKINEENNVADPNIGKSDSIVSKILGNTPTTCRYCEKSAAFPLKSGSKGYQVAVIQYVNNIQNPSNKITVDGDWGAKTQEAFARLGNKYNFAPTVLTENDYNKLFKKYETQRASTTERER